MLITFPQLVKQAYQDADDFQTKDSQVLENIRKVDAAVNAMLTKFERYSEQFFTQKTREWSGELTKPQQTMVNSTCTAASTFFYLYDGVETAVATLKASVFTAEEREWLTNEASSMLTYLQEIQATCEKCLDNFNQEELDQKLHVFKAGVEALKLDVPVKPPSGQQSSEPNELDIDLAALSPNLQELEKEKAKLEELQKDAQALFDKLDAWKRAVENNESAEAFAPTQEEFQIIFNQVEALSFQELRVPAGLHEKVFLCSKVAGRALEKIAAISARLHAQLEATKGEVLATFETYQTDHTLCREWKATGQIPSPNHFISQLMPHLQAPLRSLQWLMTLPRTVFGQLQESIAHILPEQNAFRRLANESASPAEFLKKVDSFHSGQIDKLTTSIEEKKGEIQGLETRISRLTEEKEELRKNIKDLKSQLNEALQPQERQKLEDEQKRLQEELNQKTDEVGKLTQQKNDLADQLARVREELDIQRAAQVEQVQEPERVEEPQELREKFLEQELTIQTWEKRNTILRVRHYAVISSIRNQSKEEKALLKKLESDISTETSQRRAQRRIPQDQLQEEVSKQELKIAALKEVNMKIKQQFYDTQCLKIDRGLETNRYNIEYFECGLSSFLDCTTEPILRAILDENLEDLRKVIATDIPEPSVRTMLANNSNVDSAPEKVANRPVRFWAATIPKDLWPLSLAVQKRNAQATQTLLENGAKVGEAKMLSMLKPDRVSCLEGALELGDIEVISALLKGGANPNLPIEKQRPYHGTCSPFHIVFELLPLKGYDGVAIVKELLKADADPLMEDTSTGETSIDVFSDEVEMHCHQESWRDNSDKIKSYDDFVRECNQILNLLKQDPSER